MNATAGTALLVSMAVASFGCGTRVASEARAQRTGPAGQPVASAAPALPVGDLSEGAAPTAAPVLTGSQAVTTSGGAPAPVAGSRTTAPAVQGSGTGTAKAPVTGATPTAPSETGVPGAGTVPGPGTGTAPEAGKKSPVVIGSVGTLSGPIGAVFLVQVQGTQTWVRYINERNGVNGHQIQYLIYDDGGDPARHFAQVREAVERKHVIGFLQNQEGITGGSSVNYLNEKRIPVLGSEGGAGWFYTSPMHFPQKVHYEGLYAIGLFAAAEQMLLDKKTKLGTITCVEIQTCAETDAYWTKHASSAGVNQVYRGRASVTSPDYAAECLSARNAGAEVILMALDTASVSRVALSCARQGYRPTYATLGGIAADRMKDDPNFEGLIVASDVFPYFQSDTPATAEYQQIMRTLGKSVPQGIGPATGWVSGKVFEKAAARMPEPPTSEALLRGLWSLRDETVGGLSMPLTYRENQPTKLANCWFTIRVKDGTWVSPDGNMLHCR